MKKKSILLITIFSISITVYSQDYSRNGMTFKDFITFGVKAGLNVSDQNIDSNESEFKVDSSPITSFHLGVYGNVTFSEKISFQPEVLYSREGSEIDLDFIKFKQMLSYLNIPTLLAVKPFQNDLAIIAGPQFGFLLKDELDIDISDGEILDSAFKNFQFSAVLGLEYQIIEKLSAGIRYNFGINNISNTNDGSSIKNNVLQVYVSTRIF